MIVMVIASLLWILVVRPLLLLSGSANLAEHLKGGVDLFFLVYLL